MDYRDDLRYVYILEGHFCECKWKGSQEGGLELSTTIYRVCPTMTEHGLLSDDSTSHM